jgi:hypothetical protein
MSNLHVLATGENGKERTAMRSVWMTEVRQPGKRWFRNRLPEISFKV